MTRTVRIAGLLTVIGLLAWSCSKTEAQTSDIRVETAVCDMCAHNIEQAAGKVEGVQSVVVDMEKKIAKVSYDAGKISVAAIEDAIVASGYAANDKAADEAAYENLPDCCKIHVEESSGI
ncbi:heavy-metal-associated domain-containing protein [Candidatus Neomarinimicrobiota bacterium]